MRYQVGSDVTFKMLSGRKAKPTTHKGVVTEIKENVHFGHTYVITTNYGNVVELTEEEVN